MVQIHVFNSLIVQTNCVPINLTYTCNKRPSSKIRGIKKEKKGLVHDLSGLLFH
jgi:hypothetical protein